VTTVATRVTTCDTARANLEVDLSAVAANTRLFSARTSGALMAVVKADGFGHGAVDVARTALAHGASWLGVTSLDEAFTLREAGLRAPVLSWLNAPGADFHEARRQDVDVAVPSQAHLRAALGAGLAAGVAIRVHLHLDVGMARDGAAPSEWRRLCRHARDAERSGALRVVGVMGHLANADTPGDPGNAGGRARFAWGLATARAAGLRPPLRHLAATASTLTDRASLHTLSRVGAGLVGIDPSGTTRLSPALTLTAPVVGVRRVAAGTPVGYGGSWRASRATTLAQLPLGYADGVPRVTSGRAQVLVRGRRRPLVGRVSMDQVVVDLGDDTADLGEVAILFGPGHIGEPTAAEWAAWAGTIEHEIVTGIGARVRRVVRS
jgi:alanine racemase